MVALLIYRGVSMTIYIDVTTHTHTHRASYRGFFFLNTMHHTL